GAVFIFFFQAEDGIRDFHVTGVQTCALPIWSARLRLSTTALRNGSTAFLRLRARRLSGWRSSAAIFPSRLPTVSSGPVRITSGTSHLSPTLTGPWRSRYRLLRTT